MKQLDEAMLQKATELLARRDANLAEAVARYGVPPLWARPQGFSTLVRIILDQQVSISSARAAYDRLVQRIGEPTPEGFLTLDDAELKVIGFSRQKTGYSRSLAENLIEGTLKVDRLPNLSDDEARDVLMSQKGIGRWSADIYLIMALLRPDVLPLGDLALVSAVARIKALPGKPSVSEFEEIGEAWRPWRSVAARIAWFYYLEGKA